MCSVVSPTLTEKRLRDTHPFDSVFERHVALGMWLEAQSTLWGYALGEESACLGNNLGRDVNDALLLAVPIQVGCTPTDVPDVSAIAYVIHETDEPTPAIPNGGIPSRIVHLPGMYIKVTEAVLSVREIESSSGKVCILGQLNTQGNAVSFVHVVA